MMVGRRLYLIFVFLYMLVLGGYAQQVWHGKLTGDTKWSGEIVVDGDIIVPANLSLNIEPGTKIKIKPNTDVTSSGKDKSKVEIYLYGSLICNGTPTNKIIFTSDSKNPKMSDWYGIILKNKKGTNIIDNTIVEYAYAGLTIINCSAVIKNSIFRYNYYAGISAELRSTPFIQNCVITGNDYAGIKCEYGAKPVIKSSIITQNSHGVIIFNEAEPILGKIEANNEVKGGYNRIFENFDYNVYNHTYKQIYAQVNTWLLNSEQEIKSTIFDKSKDPQYGSVIIQPIQSKYEMKQTLASRAVRKNTQRMNPAGEPKITRNLPKMTASAETTNTKGNKKLISQAKPTVAEKKVLATNSNQNKVAKSPQTDQKKEEIAQNKGLNETQGEKEIQLAKKTETEKPAEVKKPEEEILKEDPNEIYWSLKKPAFEYILDQKPKRIKVVLPKFPVGVPKPIKTVRVFLSLIVGVDGSVESVHVLKVDGREEFGQAAVEAAKQFKYTPGTLKGKPVKFVKTERIDFK